MVTGKVRVKEGMENCASQSLMTEPGIAVTLALGKVHGDPARLGAGFYLITRSTWFPSSSNGGLCANPL